MKFATMMLAGMLFASAAYADEGCPWNPDENVQVFATMTTVSVDGRTYDVKGAAARSMFLSTLSRCGSTEAAMHFERWRSNRRWTNITAIVGLCVVWPALIATPFTAMSAGESRDAMVMALSSGR